MKENFPNLVKVTDIQIQEAHKTLQFGKIVALIHEFLQSLTFLALFF